MKIHLAALLAVIALAGVGTSAAYELEISGYVDGEFQAVEANQDPLDFNSDTEWGNSFGNNSDLLLWVGTHTSDRVAVQAELQYQQDEGRIDLNQAMIDWTLKEEQMVARFGKYYFPFGIEYRSQYSPTNHLVSRPSIMAWTENGVSLWGSTNLGQGEMELSYDFAVGNGLASRYDPANPNTWGNRNGFDPLDDLSFTQTRDAVNNNKSLGGRLCLVPMEGVEFGGSLAWGRYDAAGEESYLLYGAHGIYAWEGLDLRGELRYMTLDTPAGWLPSARTSVDCMEFYGQAAYRMSPQTENVEYVEVALRAGYLDWDADTDDTELTQVAFGGTLSPAEHLRFKGEFQLNTESVDPQPANNMVLFQAVVDW